MLSPSRQTDTELAGSEKTSQTCLKSVCRWNQPVGGGGQATVRRQIRVFSYAGKEILAEEPLAKIYRLHG
jgi:hypothetical protein